MQEIFNILFSAFLIDATVIYSWYKLREEKIIYANKNLYIVYLAFVCLTCCSVMINICIKLPLLLIIYIILHQVLFKCDIQETIISVIETQATILISELIMAIVVIGIFNMDMQLLQSNLFLMLIPNVITVILVCILFQFRFLIDIKTKLCSFMNKLHIKIVFFIMFLLMTCANIILIIAYYESTTIIIPVVEFVILLIYTVISILMLKEKNTSEVYRIGYEEQQKALQDNVLLLDQECMKNHENVNQLYTIEGLARNNDTKGILEYIGVVIKEKKQEDNTLTRRIKRIPLATIQGLIYPKLGIMKDNNIDFQVVLARNIKEFDFTKVDMKTNMELCKILGVLIDNAIDEVTKLKDRKIKLELFCKNGDLHIDVSNNYGKLLDNMDEVGVTSKEGLHGYGLGIIAQITKQNPKLQNQKNINANRFHQIVVVSNSIDNKKKNV